MSNAEKKTAIAQLDDTGPADDSTAIADLGRAALSLAEETKTGHLQLAAVGNSLEGITAELSSQQSRMDRLEGKLDMLLDHMTQPTPDPQDMFRRFVGDLVHQLDERAAADEDSEAIFRKLADIERWIEANQKAEEETADVVRTATEQFSTELRSAVASVQDQFASLHATNEDKSRTEHRSFENAMDQLVQRFDSQTAQWGEAVTTVAAEAQLFSEAGTQMKAEVAGLANARAEFAEIGRSLLSLEENLVKTDETRINDTLALSRLVQGLHDQKAEWSALVKSWSHVTRSITTETQALAGASDRVVSEAVALGDARRQVEATQSALLSLKDDVASADKAQLDDVLALRNLIQELYGQKAEWSAVVKSWSTVTKSAIAETQTLTGAGAKVAAEVQAISGVRQEIEGTSRALQDLQRSMAEHDGAHVDGTMALTRTVQELQGQRAQWAALLQSWASVMKKVSGETVSLSQTGDRMYREVEAFAAARQQLEDAGSSQVAKDSDRALQLEATKALTEQIAAIEPTIVQTLIKIIENDPQIDERRTATSHSF